MAGLPRDGMNSSFKCALLLEIGEELRSHSSHGGRGQFVTKIQFDLITKELALEKQYVGAALLL